MDRGRFVVLTGDSRNAAKFDDWETAYTYAQNSAKQHDSVMSIYERQGVMKRDPITTTWTSDDPPGVSGDEPGAAVVEAIERNELYELDRGHEPDTEASRARSVVRDRDS